MAPRKAMARALLCLSAALAIRLIAFALPYAWSALLVLVPPPSSRPLELHAIWMPAVGFLLETAAAGVALLGVAQLWRGRWDLGPEFASRAGFALLMFLIGAVALASRFTVAAFMGLVFVPGLGAFLVLLDVLSTIFLGLFLYAVAIGLPLRGARVASAAPLVLGIAGSALSAIGRLETPRPASLGASPAIGLALAFVSVVLWFAVYLGSWQWVRMRGAPPMAAAAAAP